MVAGRVAVWTLYAVLMGSLPALAQHDHKHDMEKRPRSELGASAAFAPNGKLWAVYKDGDYVMARSSADSGRRWEAPVRVNVEQEPIGADGDARPKIAIAPRGDIYVTWTRPLSKPYTGNIRFARSTDGGRAFSKPITVHVDRQEITHRFDAIALGAGGRIFIAWVDKRDAEAARGQKPEYLGAAIYYAVSDDGGATFRGDFKLADHSCECCRIALLPREDGTVVAFWRHVFPGHIRDHALARMTADGRALDFRRATFDGWKIEACPHHGPSLAADAGGVLHAVWFSQAPARSGVFYGRLRKDGVDGQRRVGGDTAEHADLAIAGKQIAIAWKEFDGERSRLKATISGDGGETWRTADLAATDGASDQPKILLREKRFYVFWNTRNEPLSVKPLP